MHTPLDRRLSALEVEIAGIVADPGLSRPERGALRRFLGVVQGVRKVRREKYLRLLPRRDVRVRQLPTGDRDDGGRDDAA